MPGELPDTATDHGGMPVGFWYGLVSLLAMLVGAFARNVLPTIPPLLTAANAGKQQRDEEARKLRAEWQALLDRSERRAERAEEKSAHYEGEADRIAGDFNSLLQRAHDAHLPDCPPWAFVRPYTPPKPPDASHD